MRTTTAVIHHDNLRHNLTQIQTLLQKFHPPAQLCVALKANAYGHGLIEVAQTCEQEGVNSFSVANVHEGVSLRERGIRIPVYLCSLPLPQEIPDIVAYHITPMVSDEEMLALFGKEAARQRVIQPAHLKVDTGMGRTGCLPEEALQLRKSIDAHPSLHYEGISTHFSTADTDEEFTQTQRQKLETVLQEFDHQKLPRGMVHAANTAAALQYPQTHYDFVRIGIGVYGYASVPDLNLNLRPVMELQSHLVFIKKVAAGTPISYGRTYYSKEECYIGTITAGYGDGINRLLSNRIQVLIDGKLYPQVGTICMDHCMVNLGKKRVSRFASVVFFGPDTRGNSAMEWAALLNSIPYEITCNISWSVPRISQ